MLGEVEAVPPERALDNSVIPFSGDLMSFILLGISSRGRVLLQYCWGISPHTAGIWSLTYPAHIEYELFPHIIRLCAYDAHIILTRVLIILSPRIALVPADLCLANWPLGAPFLVRAYRSTLILHSLHSEAIDGHILSLCLCNPSDLPGQALYLQPRMSLPLVLLRVLIVQGMREKSRRRERKSLVVTIIIGYAPDQSMPVGAFFAPNADIYISFLSRPRVR